MALPSASSYGCHQKSRVREGSQVTSLTFTHSYSPNFECERPSPELLTPPHEQEQAPWLNIWSFTQTMPASTRRARRSPFARFMVQTEAPSPNSESFARATASSSSSTVTIGTTGPKISSRMIRMSWVTPVSTAGRKNGSSAPPQWSVAPFATASSTSSLTSSSCSRETMGPTSVSQSSGSPTVSSLAPSTTPSTKRSAISLTTYTRSMPEQVWPALANPPQRQPETAFGRFASAQTIIASLPPSSSTEPFIRCAHSTPTWRPTSTDPVKKIFDALDSTSACPTPPPPCTVRTSPSGTPARSNTSWIRWPISGVSDAGFTTTQFPAIRVIAPWNYPWSIPFGEVAITPTTPSGS